ncbi:MAG: FAD-linked oxidase C-terminal domain-containing protein [Gammaproteobacteria bacterium]|jgi:FAD/FMN-containing dehydrogenase/Fe-S oxidoreductase|nr:FAD-linked oxidase C-terminal domain-containing protein [Gammaproteobacteria bacterium]MDP6733616.1 FAD-linked oxidase C-terminal domain-containing protein [Gammaproteobacteria bacterium]
MQSKSNKSPLARRLKQELQGDVLFDDFSRGRYSTDASIYQLMPIGVVIPHNDQDVEAAVKIAAEEGIPVLPRGGGTSQNGQAIGEALLIDSTRHLNQVVEFDQVQRTVCVQPGMVLDQLNRYLKPHGLIYPVDVSTANRATLGGMTGNNSCGARSIRYGNMVHNVRSVEALLADGTRAHFKSVNGDQQDNPAYQNLVQQMLELGKREAGEIRARFPDLLRRVGGYNIDELINDQPNMGRLLVGSEGTLGFFQRIHLDLQPIPPAKVLGVCHFPTFYQAMDATRHIVKLDPAAVELVDRTMIELARDIPIFAPTVNRFVQGEPDALLLVEFAGDDRDQQLQSLGQLVELMGDLGFPDAVVQATDAEFQNAIWEVRKSGLNIMMSMKGDGKPVSFIEDCAVQLEDLAEYTRRLTDIFHKHGTTGTFYAHASVGTLHVRPVLNMKQEAGATKMRAIVEECLEIVREYKGSHSGEHGDGISRSEFHESMFGKRMVENFEEVKHAFDPTKLFNPGKIVNPHKMDDREIMRFAPGYAPIAMDTKLDWSEWGGFNRAIEMCNNNGACRKANVGTMCPSYRISRDEQHLTRGRANTLRLAITGQLGKDAFTSHAMYQAMELCVSCKGCKRECPTGVDMARMKIEFLDQYHAKHGLSLRDRLFAYLPRYAPKLRRLSFLLNLRDQIPGIATLSQWIFGLASKRPLLRWRSDHFVPQVEDAVIAEREREVVLLVDSFNSCFEAENARAAMAVLSAAGFHVTYPRPVDGGRPLCCGRTFFSSGLLDEARVEVNRMLDTLIPYVERGVPIIGLEPSCLLTLRDEYVALVPGADTEALAENSFLLEEFLAAEHDRGRLNLSLRAIDAKQALLHGHCHQKAFAVMSPVQKVLSLIPELEVSTIDSSCCGMAGSFGYEKEHYDSSMQMGELSLFPAVREADEDVLVIADGISCRGQISHGSGRQALHVVRVLQMALDS